MALDSDTLAQLLDTVRRFVRERLVPAEEKTAEDDRVPEEIVAEMRALGLFGLSIPAEYGGLGLTMEEVLVAFELGQTSPAFRSDRARRGIRCGVAQDHRAARRR
jgi:acyl-CoA dehydrogenase